MDTCPWTLTAGALSNCFPGLREPEHRVNQVRALTPENARPKNSWVRRTRVRRTGACAHATGFPGPREPEQKGEPVHWCWRPLLPGP